MREKSTHSIFVISSSKYNHTLRMRLFYKKKRICRIHLPNMKKGETCEFGVNIHDRFFHKDRRELVFKLKKGKRFRTYKLADC